MSVLLRTTDDTIYNVPIYEIADANVETPNLGVSTTHTGFTTCTGNTIHTRYTDRSTFRHPPIIPVSFRCINPGLNEDALLYRWIFILMGIG